jgi:hypothetical protein
MFKLYTDKNNTFKCKIVVEGANEETSIARLIIEGESHDLMFEGRLKDQICEVNIGKFKNFDNFKAKGQVRLEVIADDTYFIPWKSEYILEQSRVVTVEVLQEKENSKPVVEVKEVSYIDTTPKVLSNNHGENIYKMLVKENVQFANYTSFNSMIKNNSVAKQTVKKYISQHNISKSLLESTLGYLVDKF